MRLTPVATAVPLLDDRRAFVAYAADFTGLFAPTKWPDGHFVLLVLADVSTWPDAHFAEWAEGVLRAGAVYVCCWGPGADRLEERIDEAAQEIERRAGLHLPVIMTSQHESETMDEALWFAANATWPAEEYEDTCDALVVVAVGDPAWQERAVEYLAAGAPPPDEAGDEE